MQLLVDQAVDGNALLHHSVVFTAQQKVHIIPALGQHGAVKAADCARADDADLQFVLVHTTLISMICYWYLAMVRG